MTPTRPPRPSPLRALLTVGLPALAAWAGLTLTGVLDPLHAALLVVVVATAVALWRRLDEEQRRSLSHRRLARAHR